MDFSGSLKTLDIGQGFSLLCAKTFLSHPALSFPGLVG